MRWWGHGPRDSSTALTGTGEVVHGVGSPAGVVAGLRLLLPFARHGRGRYLAAAVLAVAGTASQLLPYWAVYHALTVLVAGTASRDGLARDALLAAIGVVGMVGLLGASTWMSHRAAFATLEHLRLRIGQRLGEMPLGYLTRQRSGEVQRVLNDDVERLESFLAHAVPDLVSAAGVLVVTSGWLLVVDWRMGLVALCLILVTVPMMIAGVSIGAEKTEAYGQRDGPDERVDRGVRPWAAGSTDLPPAERCCSPRPRRRSGLRPGSRRRGDGRSFRCTPRFYTLLTSNVLVIVPAGLWVWRSGSLSTADLLFFLILGLGYTCSLMKLMQFTTQLGRLASARR